MLDLIGTFVFALSGAAAGVKRRLDLFGILVLVAADAWSDAVPLDWSKPARFAGIRSLYRDLIGLRRTWHDTTRGLTGHNVNVHHVNRADKFIAFHR